MQNKIKTNSQKNKSLKNIINWFGSFKDNKKTLIVLIVLDIFMAVGSNIVDWPAISKVDWYLIPFAPICSLYPLTLAIWFLLKYLNKKIPNWFTIFIFIGITSYGIMAQIYYPVFIYFHGLEFNLIGNMFWVMIYAVQSLIIVSEIRPLESYKFFILIAYFLFKDYSDRFLGTFYDIVVFNFTERSINILFIVILLLHISSFILVYVIGHHQKRNGLKSLPNE